MKLVHQRKIQWLISTAGEVKFSKLGTNKFGSIYGKNNSPSSHHHKNKIL